MKKCVFEGSGVALITPFTEDNGIDTEAFGRLIDYQLREGSDAIVIFGTTGESSTLTDEEKTELAEFTVKRVGGKVPVIAGAGSNNTRRGVELSCIMESVGVDALLHVTPYYNKTNQEGLIRHFRTVASSVNIPILLYNVPSRTGMTINVETCKSLADVDNIVGIKEASGDVRTAMRIKSEVGKDFAVYSGNDDVIVPTLAMGGNGVISVLANILPAKVSAMCHSYFKGDVKTSLLFQQKYMPLISLLFCEINPMPIKYALSLMGYCREDTRLPLWHMSDDNKLKLRHEMERLDII
ncbi:MAG: 4-hydroxy-tetrahydrodipicolinate synthase [Bacillota bacterium]|nr:4-hydroxy-tetrahydrodipicolinate synthase [Bacillota bacterium]